MGYFIISVVLSIFIIPLPFSVKGVFVFNNGKTYLNLYFFRFIKIKSVYLNYSDKKFFLHLTDKKAIEFSPRDMIPEKDNIDAFSTFNFTKIRYALVLNACNDIGKFLTLSFVNQLNFTTFSVLKETYPLTDFKGDVIITQDKNLNGIIFDVGLCFNVLTITKEISKSLFKGDKNA